MLGAQLARLSEHDQSKRRQPDRWLRLRLDRIRRFHVRKANEFVETDVPRHRVDGLSLLHQ